MTEEVLLYYLKNSLSPHKEHRLEANAYLNLAEECKFDSREENRSFYLMLTSLIKSHHQKLNDSGPVSYKFMGLAETYRILKQKELYNNSSSALRTASVSFENG